MSAIAPREVEEERAQPLIDRPQPEKRPAVRPRSPGLVRFAFMWDGWRPIEVDDGFVLA